MTDFCSATGHCLCGKVSITAHSLSQHLGACHCQMCRTWSSGPFMALDAGSEVKITGEQFVTVYDSSEWAERAFCNQCGSNLFYRLKGNQQHYVSSGLFKDLELSFTHQVFIDSKPACYSFAEDNHKMTAAEVFAQVDAE